VRPTTPARNVSEPFAAVAAQHQSLPAIEVLRRDGVETVTWGDLQRWAEQTAAWLFAHGVKAGDRCAVLAENDARWCAAFWGVLRAGAVVVPLDTTYKPAQVARLLRDCGARALFISPRLLAVARGAVKDLENPPDLALLHGSDANLPTLDEIVSRPPASLPECPATPNDPAIILYTSGTTSDPKGVVLSHGNLLAILEAVPQVFRVDERDSLLAVLPLFHALALVVNLLLPAAVGGRSVFLETVNTTELLRAFAERNPTAFCCVPQFFYLIRERVLKEVERGGWLKRAAFRGMLRLNGALRGTTGLNLGGLFFARIHRLFGRRMRMLVSGGSRFDPEVQRDFYRLGFDILQGYGLTECCGPATVTREGERAFGTVGHPLPGVEVKILPAEARPDGEKGDGEVAIRGPNVMQGYFNRPEVTAAAVRDGWLHTGDLGYLDAQGRLFVTGRAKDVIVLSSGKNIYPEEIETHYLQSPFIREMCVLGLARPQDGGGERLHAVVVPDLEVMRERKVVNTKEILRYEIEGLSLQLPSHKRALSYEVWTEELPRTTTRKLRRFEIEARVRKGKRAAETAHEERALTPEEEIWLADPVVERALGVIRAAAKGKRLIHPDANIELELGLDSMERVELLAQLEQEFGADVSDDTASRIYTVRELIEAIRPAAASAPLHPGRLRAAARTQAWEELLRAPMDDPDFTRLLKPRPLFMAFAFVAMRVFYLVIWLLFRFRVLGRQHLPSSGPFLLCPNHQSYLDALFLASALPYRIFRRVFFVGATEYFASPLMRWVARRINLIPVDPDVNLVRAMQAGAFGLRHGKVLVLFPEGERSIDGTVRRFKKGASILSQHLQASIVPAAFDGLHRVWPRGKSPQGLARVSLRFGAPMRPPAPDSSADAETGYAAAADQLRAQVEAMWRDLRQAG